MQLNHHRRGRGEPLVLIHGIGHRWQGWEPVMRELEERRELIALDLPGFGQSPMPPPGTPAGYESLTGLVSEFLDELGLERPHVAGNSLGGLIALELARRGRVGSATALSPAGFQSLPESAWSYLSLRLFRRSSRLLDGRVEQVAASPAGRRLAFSQLVAHPERAPLSELAADVHALAQAPWFDENLSRVAFARFTGGQQIAVPITVAWGQHDRLLLARQLLRAGAELPQARLVVLRDCGHVPFHDDPQQVARVLLEGSGG